MTLTINGTIEFDMVEDGGTFNSAYVMTDDINPINIELTSFSDVRDHAVLRSWIGKKVRVTLEEIE